MKLDEERTRLDNEITNIQTLVSDISAQLSDQAFLSKTSEDIIQEMNRKIANYQDQLVHMQQQRKRLI